MAAGDRLRAERQILGSTVSYMHHGIDVGDGTVVHARPHDFRRPFAGGGVVRTSLEAFAGGSPVWTVTEPAAAFPGEEVVRRALSYVGRPGYCPVVDNCEHFATWCATGRRASRQIDLIAHRMSGAATRVVAAVSTRSVGGLAIRTAVGTTVRAGLRALVPTAIVGEVAALAAEWRAHRNGRSAQESRLAGERAGLVTTAAAFALVGLRAGPAGAVAGAVAGAAVWAGGTVMRGRA
ncbi:MAG: hypothetical protein EBS51_03820 [Planctomycetia bacterium]|jgi:hypothetical protein|nr:hypothetical protein [Planctomycetia bacterium]